MNKEISSILSASLAAEVGNFRHNYPEKEMYLIKDCNHHLMAASNSTNTKHQIGKSSRINVEGISITV